MRENLEINSLIESCLLILKQQNCVVMREKRAKIEMLLGQVLAYFKHQVEAEKIRSNVTFLKALARISKQCVEVHEDYLEHGYYYKAVATLLQDFITVI